MQGQYFWVGSLVSVVCSVSMVIQERRNVILKKQNANTFSNIELPLVSIFMLIDPILVQAIYFYGLRKVSPHKAKTANLLGFALFVPSMLIYLFLVSVR